MATIQIMPEIRQTNNGSKEPVLGPTMPQIPAQVPAHEGIDLEGKNRGISGACPIPESPMTDPYTLALAAMPLLDDRIKFSAFVTSGGQPIKSLEGLLRAIEAGEWPAGKVEVDRIKGAGV